MNYIVFASLILIQSCYAEVVINTSEEFWHFVYETSWKANASNYVNNPAVKGWFKADKYKDSIYIVMSKAIADCIQKKEEFANYNKESQIVTFTKTTPGNYKPENWNAVILWNFLAHVIDDRYEKVTLDNDGISEVGKKLNDHYKKQYESEINKAVEDIQAYAHDLNLYKYIYEITQAKKSPRKNRFFKIRDNFNEDKKSANFLIYNVNASDAEECSIKYNIKDGKVTPYIMDCGDLKIELTPYMNQLTTYKKIELNKDYMVPRTKNEIHALPNFDKFIKNIINENGENITNNKCWFNTSMLNLYNSNVIQGIVEELSKLPQDSKNAYPSKWIKKIFNDIRSGNMSEYGTHLKGLIEALENLEIGVSDINSGDKSDPDIAISALFDGLRKEGINQKIIVTDKIHSIIENNKKCNAGCHIKSKLSESVISVSENSLIFQEALKLYDYDECKLRSCCMGKMKMPYTISNRLIHLPFLLVFKEKTYNKIDSDDEINLTINGQEYKYKLIGVVDKEGSNHFIAKIKFKNGEWYYISDLGDAVPVKMDAFDRQNENRDTIFYERIE